MMKKALFIIIISFALTGAVNAAQSPNDPESCTQRGYEIIDGQCIFPDGNKCPMQDFVMGVCGIEYKTKDYCVSEGKPVWDKNECCEGTIAYLKPGLLGQQTCQKISIFERVYNQVKYNPYVWIFGIAVLVSIAGVAIYRKRRK